MATDVIRHAHGIGHKASLLDKASIRYLVPVGRVLFAAIFLMAAPGHFKAETIAFAASQGLPMASVAVPLSGVLLLLGGLSVAVGYKAKLGAWLLALFLVPATLVFHDFWTIADPMMRQMQQVMFMKNLSMLGGTLLIAYFGAGPLSIDHMQQAKQRSNRPVLLTS